MKANGVGSLRATGEISARSLKKSRSDVDHANGDSLVSAGDKGSYQNVPVLTSFSYPISLRSTKSDHARMFAAMIRLCGDEC